MNPSVESEISSGDRFAFGANWSQFAVKVDERRIAEAEASLAGMLGQDSLAGEKFVDVGCGSGLFSLAARRLGAEVTSFDFDPDSVATTKALRNAFRPGDEGWQITEGSVLDVDFLTSLGTFSVVYSWGVLHHTGRMWQAMGNVELLTRGQAKMFLALYNDQGRKSKRWTSIKRAYNRAGPLTKRGLLVVGRVYLADKDLVTLPQRALKRLRTDPNASVGRGMDRKTDLRDWVGGYPFEVAAADEVVAYYLARGWQLTNLKTVGGDLGCNEYVFSRQDA